MQLSKSDYLLFLKHPAWLWLEKHDKAKLPPVDEATQAIFDAGYLFEGFVEQRFPGAVRLGFSSAEDGQSLSFGTKQALQGGATTLFQARFEHDDLSCTCDVIEVVGDNIFDLYEIKSSSDVKPEHEHDLAFQLIVLESCGYTIRNLAVIHVNRDYIRRGDIDATAISTVTDITDRVKANCESTKRSIASAIEVMRSLSRPDISPAHCGPGCLKDWLVIYRGLTAVPPYSIYDLARVTPEQIQAWEEQGIIRLSDIPDDIHLSPTQQRQVTAVKQGVASIVPEKIGRFLADLTYPLYFLDYETLSSAIPVFDGTKPYQQIPFQYSLHILDTPSGAARHTEYLHRDKTNPAEQLSQALKVAIGSKGSVIVWNQSFEKTCNLLLGQFVPALAGWFQLINDRIIDLMVPYSSGWYHHQDFHGSASIKHVLPVLVPELSYTTLGIRDGGSAQRLWMEAVLDGKHSSSDHARIMDDLVAYCTLDTLAMVKIYEKLSTLSQTVK